jgi:hypothetical protein
LVAILLADHIVTIVSSYDFLAIFLAHYGFSYIDAPHARTNCYPHGYTHYSKNDMGRVF